MRIKRNLVFLGLSDCSFESHITQFIQMFLIYPFKNGVQWTPASEIHSKGQRKTIKTPDLLELSLSSSAAWWVSPALSIHLTWRCCPRHCKRCPVSSKMMWLSRKGVKSVLEPLKNMEGESPYIWYGAERNVPPSSCFLGFIHDQTQATFQTGDVPQIWVMWGMALPKVSQTVTATAEWMIFDFRIGNWN